MGKMGRRTVESKRWPWMKRFISLRAWAQLLLFWLLLVGCSDNADLETTETPEASAPTPNPPEALLALPLQAQMRCTGDPNLDRGTIVLWEYPGLESQEDDSSLGSDTGSSTGRLDPCTPVVITDHAWSHVDEEFYVYVVNEPDKGWVVFRLVSVPEEEFSIPHSAFRTRLNPRCYVPASVSSWRSGEAEAHGAPQEGGHTA